MEIPNKDLFRIGEVSRLTSTKSFVLRYWETEFPMLQPVKSPSGHRLYRREDIETVLRIKHLLYEEGFTIAGARKHLSEGNIAAGGNGNGARPAAEPSEPSRDAPIAPARTQSTQKPAAQRGLLIELRDELRAILTLLKAE